MTLRELSLFTGAGGGLLGTLLLGWRPIGYVEYDNYCQRVIAQRIADGIIPNAPIFGDVREFIQSGAAAEYRGFADVVTGGFPCQPFSVAGRQRGADDPRNMWPATAECVRLIRPRFCFFENVPGLLNSGYFGTIVADLAACGYGVRWRVLSAAELGAPHKRDRLWILAHTIDDGLQGRWPGGHETLHEQCGEGYANSNNLSTVAKSSSVSGDVSHSARQRTRRVSIRQGRQDQASTDTDGVRKTMADANGGYGERTQNEICTGRHVSELGSEDVPNAQHTRDGWGEQSAQSRQRWRNIYRPLWWEVEPELGRLADGIPHRVDRLRAAGNAQVPAVVAAAWHLLTADLFIEKE